MFKNYFKTAWRNLAKNKVYSFLNILGLAIGMSVAMLIGLWVQHELSYDSFNVNREHIAMVMKKTLFNNEKGTQAGISLPLYDELKTNYPEVKRITRLDWGGNHSLMVGDKKLSSKGHFADPDFLRMFTFPLVEGQADLVLKDPYSIVLTQSLSKSLFGDADPVGKFIKLDNQHNVKVTGVLKDVPKNSSIEFDFLLPYELNVLTDSFVKNSKGQWQNNFLQNFVQLNDGVTVEAFSRKIAPIIQQKSKDKKEGTLFVHPMKKGHLYSEFKDWINIGGTIEYVKLFAVIGIFVLIIACINFMNLSTARSEKRAKEVAIRKTVGSQRKQLVVQFLGESVITALIAFVLSLFIVKLSLPWLSQLGFKDVIFNFSNLPLLLVLFAGCVVTGLLAGSYPALYLSGFKPIKVLKGTFSAGKAANLPRKILVVIQFSFSIALIIGTIIVFQQIQHARNRPLGYRPDNLISFGLSNDLTKNFEPLKRDLLATGYLEAVSRSSSPMTGVYNQWDDFSWEGKDPDSHPLFSAIMIDHDYDKASGVILKEGRFFSKEFLTDSNAVVLNEAAVKLMGFKNPLGKMIRFANQPMTVIGVVQNVIMEDPFRSVMPAIMLFRPYFISQGMIRFKTGTNLQKALAAIQPVMATYNPAYPFEYRFVDEEFNKKFQAENQVGALSRIFAALAIFISCLGLFGLASFMAERRTKEIGVRKVLGASVSQLWLLLSKDFVLLVFISCLIASPLALYFLQDWLKKYEYRIEISPLVFISAGIIAIIITLATISFQAIKAALANPVKSLRTE
ncbi:ABC transporter permease [Danxiaibacter flavus]|uniref:ABC transporter permease n=1 Tax=Danxiaibacter flavus TaxID=3049108 RepID=A0ABV3ZKF2_9BACT|nr:ABC transporter permease [Chitinophagaceae bacterium DXS]